MYTIFDGGALARIRTVLTVGSLFLAAQLPGSYAHGQNLPSAKDRGLPLIQFSIKPRLCVLNAGEEVCRDQLEVKWLSAQARSLCLFQADKTGPLRCWQEQTQGQYQFELSASVSTDFQLRELDTGVALSDQRFQVVYHDKKYRRARRNPWSFF